MIRLLLFPVLVGVVLLPLLLLVVVSLGADWFWPAVLPLGLDAGAWEGLATGAGEGARLAPAALNSTVLAAGTGLIAAALGLPLGRAIARLSGWRRGLGAAAAFLPVAVPPLALAVGLQYTTLRAGLGGGLPGVMVAHVVPALGYTALFFLGVFTLHDDRLEEEARTLGAGRVQTFARVTLPVLRRPLIEAFVLGFLVSWAQVPLTLLIGQGLVPTLAVEVLGYVGAGQDRIAAAGAILLVIPPLLTMAAAGFAIRRVAAPAV